MSLKSPYYTSISIIDKLINATEKILLETPHDEFSVTALGISDRPLGIPHCQIPSVSVRLQLISGHVTFMLNPEILFPRLHT